MISHPPIIGIVSPCYNEEQVLPETASRLDSLLSDLVQKNLISDQSFAAFVDDGSKDRTWEIIEEVCSNGNRLRGLKLAGNVGHQNALLGGLLTFNQYADALISIDADLQDDISVIEEMIRKFIEGSDVVYGVRKERKTDTRFKRTTALMFYSLMRKMKLKVGVQSRGFQTVQQKGY